MYRHNKEFYRNFKIFIIARLLKPKIISIILVLTRVKSWIFLELTIKVMQYIYMKKALLLILLAFIVVGCGVKSAPDHPSGKNFPRTYPVN